jgi:hypothetical protein
VTCTVVASYHGRSASVADGVRYITHREERLPGGSSREVHAVGASYRALADDESAVKARLWDDGAGLAAPRYYRLKLTADDPRARLLSQLPAHRREAALREAVEATFGRELPLAEGVFVTHSHGGGLARRPYGHPHVHVHLSPRQAGGGVLRLRRSQLERLKRSWSRALSQVLERGVAREAGLGAHVGEGSKARALAVEVGSLTADMQLRAAMVLVAARIEDLARRSGGLKRGVRGVTSWSR